MKFVKSFGHFWYDFIIGDDPKIAVAVLLALGVLLAVTTARLFSGPWLAVVGGAVIIAFFAISLVIDARPKKTR
ncbi:MAG: hypothetical protein J2P32_04070 [Actinobacteria bacterium]|nr:hypothetical protein [Actinomycetota bacterium]